MKHALGTASLLLALLAAGASPVAAQPGPDQMTRQELLQRIQREFEEQIARELVLSDEQRAELPGILSEFGAARRELGDMRGAFMDRVAAILEADTDDPVQSLALIEEGRALRNLEEQLLVREEERLLDILEPSQVLLLQIVRDQFGDLIQSVGNRDAVARFSRGGRGLPEAPEIPRP
ncbi:MAG: hypothetical protein WEG36_15950 [Gemmatimonadota bacterium]